MLKRSLWLCAFAISLALLSGNLSTGDAKDKDKNKFDPKYKNTTYVPTADEVINKMFEMAKVTEKDVIFDLGCGDNRICYMAAKKYGCRGVGIEINPDRIREAMDQYEKFNGGKEFQKLLSLVEVRHGDALQVKDLADATVVVMYMFPEFMDLWFPIAEKTLKPGTRIVSHDYSWTDAVKGWEPTATATVKSSMRDNHKVLLWTVPEKKKART
jgi:cyclopropane fatty-acyl-phospholipid synthase-like methyltransferase